jgi:hypothetical protein
MHVLLVNLQSGLLSLLAQAMVKKPDITHEQDKEVSCLAQAVVEVTMKQSEEVMPAPAPTPTLQSKVRVCLLTAPAAAKAVLSVTISPAAAIG